jgi:hypothetical protein
MDGKWFHIFISLLCKATISKRLFSRRKIRGEIKVQQSTLGVQNNPRWLKYSARTENLINPTEKRLREIYFQELGEAQSSKPDMEVQLPS